MDTERYEPQRLHKWTTDGPTCFDSSANYIGERFDGHYVGPVSQTRDSGPLDRSNFAVVSAELEELGGEVHRFGHWGPGWYEIVLIDAGNEKALRCADEWAAALEDYPVADDEHHSELEEEEANETWQNCYSLKERIELCAEAGVSIFAARHEWFPDDDSGRIRERLLGC